MKVLIMAVSVFLAIPLGAFCQTQHNTPGVRPKKTTKDQGAEDARETDPAKQMEDILRFDRESSKLGSGTVRIKQSRSLVEALTEFNQMTAGHPIGKSQPPITVAEVVASILRQAENKIPDKKRERILAVAANKMLDSGDWLKFSAESWSDEHHFTVWLIELTIDGHKLRIRDRTISSRKQSRLEKEIRQTLKEALDSQGFRA